MFQISPQLNHLTRLMDAAQMRQSVISQNLANVNTPGYQRLDVEFETVLAEHLKSGVNPVGSIPVPQIVEEQGLSSRSDGNNVDIDREIGQLNRNSMLFQTYSQLLSSQFDLMRRAVRS